MKTNGSNALSAAFLYISTLIGAGFATGRELYVYFFKHGIFSGIFGLFISSVLFGFTAYKTLMITNSENINDHSELLEYLFGKKTGTVLETVCLFFFFILFSAMSAAMGEMIHEMTGLHRAVGSALLCTVTYALLSFKKDIASVLGVILCPVMVCGCTVLGLSFDKSYTAMPFSAASAVSAVVYTSYNMLTSTAVLCTQKGLDKKQSAKAALTIASVIFVSGIFCGMLTVENNSPLPIYDAVSGSKTSSALYVFILISAVLTTAISNAFCLLPHTDSIVICVLGFVFSLVGFDVIIEKIYYIFGLVGCMQLVMLCFPINTDKKRKIKKHSEVFS